MDQKNVPEGQTPDSPKDKAEWPIHGDTLLEDSDPPALSDVLRKHEHESPGQTERQPK